MLLQLVCLLSAAGSLSGLPDDDQTRISNALQQFSTQLLDKVAADSKYTNNVIFSPFSIYNAMLTVYMASTGNTEKLMERFLLFDPQSKPSKNYIEGMSLLEGFQYHSNEFELISADRIYHTADIRPKANTEKEFGKKVAEFKSYDEINDWVSQRTKGLIPELFPQGEIPPPPTMVFVNALYFKGFWSNALTGEKTMEPFTLHNGTTVQRLMMSAESGSGEYFSLIENKDLNAQVLSLPYKGDTISMMIILPRSKPSSSGSGEEIMRAVVKNLTRAKFQEVASALQTVKEQYVDVRIPKFKSSKKYELTKIFNQLGDGELFSESLDLSNLFETQDLHVTGIVHKAFVNVYEGGTEAAAASAITGESEAAPPSEEPPEFYADHPFIYIIYDHTNRYIHFMGILNDPGQE